MRLLFVILWQGRFECGGWCRMAPQPFLNVSCYFAEDADGNRYYTDKNGNVTYNVDSYNYVDSNGDIITDGYGYIDPYTGAYIQ